MNEVTIVGFPYTNISHSGRGIDRYLKVLIDNLKDLGVEYQLIEEGIVNSNFFKLTIRLGKTTLKILKSKSKVYHAVDPIGAFLLKVLGKKFIVTTIHDTIPLSGKIGDFGFKITIFKFLMKFALKFSSEIIVPFEYTKQELIYKFHIKMNKIKVVNYGLDLPEIIEHHNNPSVTRRKREGFKILFIGSGDPIHRGLELVLKTYLILKNLDINLTLTLVGKEQKIVSLLKSYPDLEKDAKINIINFIPESDLYSFISNFDVFLYPSQLGFSYLVVQAMFMGVPVIVANNRDMVEYVGKSGLICPSGDLDCFVNDVKSLMIDGLLRSNLIDRSLEQARSFTGKDMAIKSKVIYDELRSVSCDSIRTQ